MTIVFRADADVAMGTGHVMRCLALAEALIDRGQRCLFLSHALPPALMDHLRAAGITVERPKVVVGPLASLGDAAWVVDRAKAVGARSLVVDGYQFGPAYRERLLAAAVPVLAFDDQALSDRFHAEILVNPAPEAAQLPYAERAPGATLLLGPSYAVLRRSFRRAIAAGLPPLSERPSVLLTFGGTDPLGLTEPALEAALAAFPAEVGVLVVVGGGNPRRAALEARMAAVAPRVEGHVNTTEMAALMLRSGLALTAGGNTLGELAALGVPPAVAICVDNQEPATGWAVARGLVTAVDARSVPLTDAAAALAAVGAALWADLDRRIDMAERGRGVVDGQGAERIATALLARCG